MSKRTPHKHFNRLIKNKYRHKKESWACIRQCRIQLKMH
jgi:hypothetical protein